VGITTALYDRRALDCTSTLPLINSLNHLAYLTMSSARIRDILTIDGGVERLVCIIKSGRSREMMETWKWSLAFQCVVNIGVRGSESVRTRVVEADMVPVIATILDNYIKVIDKCRERIDAENRRNSLRYTPPRPVAPHRLRDHTSRSTFHERGNSVSEHRSSRRQAPPPSIEIPQPFSQQQQGADFGSDLVQAQLALTSPPERTTFARPHHHHHHHHHHRSQDGRHYLHPTPGTTSRHNLQPLATALPSMDTADDFRVRPVRDVDRLPSMLPALQTGITSQPESPTTPNAPVPRPLSMTPRTRRRPSLRQQLSQSGDSDEGGMPPVPPDPSVNVPDEPMVDIQTSVEFQRDEDEDAMLEAVATPLDLTMPTGSEGTEVETFNITRRNGLDHSIVTTNLGTPTNTTMNMGLPLQPPPPPIINLPQPANQSIHARYLLDRSAPPGILAAHPREEDVLMSLQLLAYVSKYCNLRSYFQQSHLVPKLKIGNQLQLLDDPSGAELPHVEEEEEEEYLLPDDVNIFPLVEKFTVRHHSADMQYWAGVVMRNLCRKDDSRGGIRQCAYYLCGKWEQYTRQFAKCRRCRRTKYCSKDCQKNAWVYHRHWCQPAA
jgi:hypothetical protein